MGQGSVVKVQAESAASPLGPVLVGIPGCDLDDADRVSLLHPAVGGVVLFSRNFSDRRQLERLVADIRSLRNPRLLICIDQEGGRVQRLREGFTRLPPLGVLGRMAHSDPDKALDMAYRHGRVMAAEVLACGIDLSFAPVLDLDRGSRVIGDRSLGETPELVTRLGRAYLAGMHDAGMKTTGKHFPGHGSVAPDSHIEDVVDPRPLDEIERSDLRPFLELASELDALMIAHVVYPAVDDQPAGYSRKWLIDYLRKGCSYRGAIFSDDLGMHAAQSVGDLPTRSRLCLDAGCDLVLVCRPEDVTLLLARLDDSPGDASAVLARLYGAPSESAQELRTAREEGVGEWARWQRSLEELGEQAWS